MVTVRFVLLCVPLSLPLLPLFEDAEGHVDKG